MEFIFELLIAFFLIVSGIFGFVGSFGMIKLKDPMSRLHAPTKATTLGVGGVLLASIFHSILIEQRLSMHELLITLFLFLTAPITALFIAKWHIHRHEAPEDLPDAGEDKLWATHAVEQVEDVPDHSAN
ncbi:MULTISPECIES: Na+/H+ antiporter subunit G [Ruegeria]|uniref:Na(+)/H(+) antiporter subunit G n=1 Tax=Ruegeria arenilitoris TaxID=1173585 RepID=A0A238JYH2_9RHOB|nr:MULTISPECIES: Na+/H+ antiporter subunit G [Ruegeria]MBY6081783.1 Na+/H+ antiporter subunit G [Ruegeria arenilitoris]UWR06293.1 Na+/H+ antiporter subunit G [Ruegeria sp. B32]SMX35710.1 Na(+)/H(+) antiporter subunit G [Ruegeria arenilitoris]